MVKQTPEQARRFYQTTRIAAWRATRFKNAALAEKDPKDNKIQGLYFPDFVRRVTDLGVQGDVRKMMLICFTSCWHLNMFLSIPLPS